MSQGDRMSEVLLGGGVPCGLCYSGNASMLLPVVFDERDAFALPQSSHVCAECLALLTSGHDEALAARLTAEFDDYGRAEVVAHLHRRAGAPTVLWAGSETLAELGRQGFVALHEHTGVVAKLAELWPAEHRISTTELADPSSDPDRIWLVRSPWESLSVPEVIVILWRWVEREPFREDEWTARISEVFGWSEDRARELLQSGRCDA